MSNLSVSILSIMAFVTLGCAAALAQSSSSSDDDVRFRKGELDLSPFGVYVDKAGGKWGAGLAGTYFLLKNVGVGAATYWTDTEGTFFDNLEAEGYWRVPVFKRLAPYAVGTVGYQFDRKYWFQSIGGGLDFRAFKRFDAFSDIQYRFSNDRDKSKDGVFIRLGLRFAL